MIPTGRLLPMRRTSRLPAGCGSANTNSIRSSPACAPDADGLVRTRLTDPASGRIVTQTFDAAVHAMRRLHAGHRQAICLEPYTCVPDAIRLAAEGHETGLQMLQPGEYRDDDRSNCWMRRDAAACRQSIDCTSYPASTLPAVCSAGSFCRSSNSPPGHLLALMRSR